MTQFRHPSIEEIRAIEIAARRERAVQIGRLLAAAAAALKSACVRAASLVVAGRIGHA